MRKLLLSLAMATGLVSAALAMDTDGVTQLSSVEIEQQAEKLHPAALYILAGRLLEEGRGQEAANWMYAGQLRYRFLIEAGSGPVAQERLQFDVLSEQIGRPVNEYIAGDVDEWLAAMDWALEWDAANDNAVTPKAEHAAALQQVRSGLADLRAEVQANRDTIPEQREANGLENR